MTKVDADADALLWAFRSRHSGRNLETEPARLPTVFMGAEGGNTVMEPR